MRRILAMGIGLAVLLCAAAAGAETLTGQAQGYGGALTVGVERDGETITGVTVVENNETREIAGEALEAVPAAIVEAGGTDIDTLAGATVTSNAIIAAVNNALDPQAYPYEAEAVEAAEPADSAYYLGLGIHSTGRLGPGADETDTPVYSVNQVFAGGVFDAQGRIVSLRVDQLEVATPNYDGAGMPHFSGFPGQGGYNWDENHDGTIAGQTEDTEDNFMAEIASWETKRERGSSYVMGTGTWAEQMDAFEALFVGMTVDEVEAWFAAYTSDRNGRPLKAGSEDAEDAAKYDALSEEEQAMLTDVTSAATMSLDDSHGNILAAIRSAYENRVPLQLPE